MIKIRRREFTTRKIIKIFQREMNNGPAGLRENMKSKIKSLQR